MALGRPPYCSAFGVRFLSLSKEVYGFKARDFMERCPIALFAQTEAKLPFRPKFI